MFCCLGAFVCDKKRLLLSTKLLLRPLCVSITALSYELNYSNFTKLNLLLWAGVNHSTPGFLVKGHFTYTAHMPELITSRNDQK